MTENPQNPYNYKGPLDPDKDSIICVPRSEDLNNVINGLKKGDYWVLLGSNQSGKTTFLRLIKNKFSNAHYIDVDLQIPYTNDREFYKSLMKKIHNEIPSKQKEQMDKFINNWDDVTPAYKFFEFLKEFVPEDDTKKIIFLLDEVDGLPNLETFLLTWRRVYTERGNIKNFNRYAVIITGSVDLITLTIGRTSPFNIAEIIYLKDFSQDESKWLIDNPFRQLGIEIEPKAKEKLILQISGHPQMLQQACYILAEIAMESAKILTVTDVKAAIETLMIKNTSLNTLKENLTKNLKLRKLVIDILDGEKKPFYPYTEFSIWGAGAIKEENSLCSIRNDVYKKYIINITLYESSTNTRSNTIIAIPVVSAILTGFISMLAASSTGMVTAGILALISLVLVVIYLVKK